MAPLARVRAEFTAAALRGDRRAAADLVLDTLRGGHPIDAIYTDVFEASQYDIGARWERNEISVAQEHVATAVTQYVMARVFAELPAREPRSGSAIVTGVEGELHQLGAQMVADLMTVDGWAVRFLGTDVPTETIVDMVAAERPQLVGISVTLVLHVPAVRALVAGVRALAPGAPAVIVGGAAVRWSPRTFAQLDVDGCATDLTGARALIARFSAAAAGNVAT